MNLRTLLWNPIIAKEYRSRMRTIRSPLAMMLYVLLLGGLGFAVFRSMADSVQGGYGGGPGSSYGPQLFTFLVIFQMLLLTFITPALTAGAISGERERQTIDLLFCTRIPPFAMIWGKLLASMSFVLLLLVLSIPIFSLVFLFGGIELDQLVTAFVVTAATALTLGALGVLFSSLAHRTLISTVAAYGAAFLVVFGTLAWAVLFPTVVDPSRLKQAPAPPAITYLSPITSLSGLAGGGLGPEFGIRYPGGGGGFSGPGSMVCKGAPGGSQNCYSVAVNGFNGGPYQPGGPGSPIPSGAFAGWQYWEATVLLQLVLALVAIAISALLIPPIKHWPWRRKAAPAPAV